MPLPVRLLTLLTLPVLLVACGPMGFDQSKELAPARFKYVNIWETYDVVVDIDASGDVAVEEHTGGQPSDYHAAQTRLTAEQRTALLDVFSDWKRLETDYPRDFNPLCEITYDGHTVTAGDNDKAPPAFRKARSIMEGIVRSALRPPTPATKSASAVPAPTPALAANP